VKPWQTLRGRLAGAMVAILLLAVGTSALVNNWAAPRPGAGLPAELDTEPYQDSLVLAAFSAAALVLIWLVSSWSLRPLARVSQQARAVGPGNATARLSRNGLPQEIAPLVDAVNGALDRMADAVTAERRFTENAAHELRTPLAVLSLRLQRARQSASPLDWPEIEGDLATMNRLVTQLLDLARKENAGRIGATRGQVNLARIAREAAAMVVPLAEARHRAVALDVPETLMVQGDAGDLRDALVNLLENAVLHGAGTVGLHAACAAPGADITLTVSDQGAGVPAAFQQAAFERFNKDSRSQGTGLGLAIVREVARNHGGDVAFVPGPGCRVAMTLPAYAGRH
jgi:two-component system sensor histidine kinase QseC